MLCQELKMTEKKEWRKFLPSFNKNSSLSFRISFDDDSFRMKRYELTEDEADQEINRVVLSFKPNVFQIVLCDYIIGGVTAERNQSPQKIKDFFGRGKGNGVSLGCQHNFLSDRSDERNRGATTK